MVRRRRLLILLGLAVLAIVAPLTFVHWTAPDVAPPAGLARPIADFRAALAGHMDRGPLFDHRFVGIETGPDDLVILYFEERPFPFLFATGELYMASRCRPLAALDPEQMSGGTVAGSRATDEELQHLRSDAQPDC